jgi:methyltransferase-like protein/SAM-dependent methyltransferase
MSTSYDSVVYPSYPYPVTHPEWLGAIGKFFGLNCPDPRTARVLELGCASGGNLLPMAEAFPQAHFVGIDLSSRQIELGQKQIEELKLKNLELRAADITLLLNEPEPFDYILCHGVYSWVPDEVRDAILEICHKKLTPQGLAYISYNTYPGWHMRGMLREIMCFHAARFETAEDQVKQSRALLEFLSQSLTSQTDPYALLMRREADLLRGSADAYLYHEHLEEHNDPCYFFEFVNQARQHQLQYVGDAGFTTMFVHTLPPQVQKTLMPLAPDLIQLEQYMDFLRNRTFRASIIGHETAPVRRHVHPEMIKGLYFSTTARLFPTTQENAPPNSREYRTLQGLTANTDNPVFQAVVESLMEAAPQSLDQETLQKAVLKRVHSIPEGVPDLDLGRVLLSAMIGGIIEFSTLPSRAIPIIAQKPKVTPLMRLQARTQNWMVNLKHHNIRVDELMQHLIPLMDGTRTRDELLKKIVEPIASGKLQMRIKDELITDMDRASKEASRVIQEKLEFLRINACLAE